MNIIKQFRKINNKYFGGLLETPRFKTIKTRNLRGFFMGVKWDDSESDLTISINYKHPDHETKRNIKETLIHEMVHLYQFQNGYKVNHGKIFRKFVKYFKAQGYKIN